jgi:hypothetical protein
MTPPVVRGAGADLEVRADLRGCFQECRAELSWHTGRGLEASAEGRGPARSKRDGPASSGPLDDDPEAEGLLS